MDILSLDSQQLLASTARSTHKSTNTRHQHTNISLGINKLRSTKEVVDVLAEEGLRMAAQVELKVAQANAFAKQVEVDKEAVNVETQQANIEAAACGSKAKDVAELQARCEQELAVAEPLVAQAEAALNTLNKKDLGASGCSNS